MDECIVRSFGFGVYNLMADDVGLARSAASQIGEVLEAWSDPENKGSHVVILASGHDTSKWEARVVGDDDVASSVRRAVSVSPVESIARLRLKMVSNACSSILGEDYDPSTLEA